MKDNIGFRVTIERPYAETVDLVVSALKNEGFGVLTQIDVKATMKEKLGEEFRPYVILGACNPPLAHRALTSDPSVGLLLPCNVTVESITENSSEVHIIDPKVMMGVGDFRENEQIRTVADEAYNKLKRVAKSLK